MLHATRGRVVVFAALALLALLPGARAEPGGPFSADLVQSQDGIVNRGTVHVSGALYRLDLPQHNGPDVVLIVEPDKDVTHVLVPRYRVYVDTETSRGRAMMYDPFAALRRALEQYEKKDEGEEAVAGHPCRRELVHYQGQAAMTCWTSLGLGWPMKIEMATQDATWVRLENAKAGPVDPALLAVPEDYEKTDWDALYEKVVNDEEMVAKAEEWDRIRPRKGRFSRRLTQGSEARILLGEGVSASAEVRYGTGEPYRWALVPMREGNELRTASECTHEGNGKAAWLDGLEPDALVARGIEGEANLSITLRGQRPLILATSEVYDQNSGGGRSWGPGLGEWTHIRITLTATQEQGFATGVFKATHGDQQESETRKHEFRLEPGKSMTLEWSAADGPIQEFDMMLQTGSLRIEVVEDTREEGARNPY